MVTCTSAKRIKQSQAKSITLSDAEKDECGFQVPGATHRECYTRASMGILPGFNNCGKATCKCDADAVIEGEDDACDADLYDEGRHFDHKELSGKGCACTHKANTMRCATDAPQVCHQCKYNEKSAKIADFADMNVKADETFPIRLGLPEHGLPEEIQGVFWLTDQKNSSSLVSFARGNDGGGIGVLDPESGIGKVRVSGDRVWSFTDNGSNWDAAKRVDLVYAFNFDSATKPREARIIPTARNLGGFANWAAGQSWIVDFEMYLLQCETNPDNKYDNYCHDEKYLSGFEKSFVWQRKSWILGTTASNFGEAFHDYKAVQVIKADGTKLPAFEHWMEYSNNKEFATPGVFHYREVDNSIECPLTTDIDNDVH
jgi:hypothetical protein